MNEIAPTPLKPKDFASDQEVRWCPGCGDYAILKAIQKTLADIGATPENTVFISGIGCSSRLPYYMATYGFHTIHGRAPAIATGTKLANPELDVWVITGDGDGFSIGGNHMLHVLRRDVDMQILVFNNEVYGLTKGQASPTSRVGMRSPSTPLGSLDGPVNPCVFALAAGARFVARSADTLQKQLSPLLAEAQAHKGASFVEILQNCIIYNDGVFNEVTDKKTAPEHTLILEHGAPMVFGAEREKGLRVKPGGFGVEVVTLGDGVAESDLLVHDETNLDLASHLARLTGPDFPTVLGVLYRVPGESYEARVHEQLDAARTEVETDPHADIDALLHDGPVWRID